MFGGVNIVCIVCGGVFVRGVIGGGVVVARLFGGGFGGFFGFCAFGLRVVLFVGFCLGGVRAFCLPSGLMRLNRLNVRSLSILRLGGFGLVAGAAAEPLCGPFQGLISGQHYLLVRVLLCLVFAFQGVDDAGV